MRPTLIAFALLAACAGRGKNSPEGEIYWACIEYYASAQACGLELGGFTPEEACDQYDLRYCDESDPAFDDGLCDEVEAELTRLDNGMAEHGGTAQPTLQWTAGRNIDGSWNGKSFKTREEADSQAKAWEKETPREKKLPERAEETQKRDRRPTKPAGRA